MANLGIKYMGLQLRNPLVAGSSGLSGNLDGVRKLEDAGVGAIVLKSIFEEQISHEVGAMGGPESTIPQHSEAASYISSYGAEYASEKYLSLISDARGAVDVPIIASLNCVTPGRWVEFARRIGDAGASAIELNVFLPPHDPGVDGRGIESLYLGIAKQVRASVDVPVSMKIGWHFSGMANFLVDLSEQVDGLVFFNRYYRTTIDIESMKLAHASAYSEPHEYEIPMRWISIMNGVARCDLAASTGVHDWDAAVRLVLVGASAVQLASVLYKEGMSSVERINKGISDWMDRHGFAGIEDFRGSMCRRALNHPAQFDRVQFMKFSVGDVD